MVLLEGKEPAPWPDPKSVPEAEVQQLLKDLGKLPPDELRGRIAALPPAQFLALNQALTTGSDWPEAFVKFVGAVQDLRLVGIKDDAAWQSWKGKAVDFNGISGLARQVGALNGDDTIEITLVSAAPLQGWTMVVKSLGKKTQGSMGSPLSYLAMNLHNENDQLAKYCHRVCTASFNGANQRGVQWGFGDTPTIPDSTKAKPPEHDPPPPEALQQLTNDEASAWETIRTAFATPRKGSFQFMNLYFLSASSKTLDAEAAKMKEESAKEAVEPPDDPPEPPVILPTPPAK
jgi:hypothetical protein